jgi:hypothetical protein
VRILHQYKFPVISNSTILQPTAIDTGKLAPDFWVKETDIWFMKAEKSFRRAQITDSYTKKNVQLQVGSLTRIHTKLKASDLNEKGGGQKCAFSEALKICSIKM